MKSSKLNVLYTSNFLYVFFSADKYNITSSTWFIVWLWQIILVFKTGTCFSSYVPLLVPEKLLLYNCTYSYDYVIFMNYLPSISSKWKKYLNSISWNYCLSKGSTKIVDITIFSKGKIEKIRFYYFDVCHNIVFLLVIIMKRFFKEYFTFVS